MKIKVIGAGGIGTALLPPLVRFLNYQLKSEDEAYSTEKVVLTIIDGDCYEMKNKVRQSFHRFGNKAEVAAEKLREDFPDIDIKSRNEFITSSSVEYLIQENDIVFMCVDNHKTRKNVSDFCGDLDNVVLISGGNEYSDGNIMVYIRKDGEDVSLPLTNKYHPEILDPQDKSPDEISCGEAVESEPQLVFMNLMIAALMLNAFYAQLKGKLNYDEVYTDIITNNTKAVLRKR